MRVEPRPAGEQALRVGMLRVREDVEHGAVLDFFAAVHHEHVVGDFGDHAEVVRDEEDRHAALVAELAEDVEDLGLDRDVERGGRLVGDQQLRIAREGHRDHHALLLAAGHLMRVGIDALLGIGNADFARAARSFVWRASALLTFWWSRIASMTCAPTVKTGLSDVIGS